MQPQNSACHFQEHNWSFHLRQPVSISCGEGAGPPREPELITHHGHPKSHVNNHALPEYLPETSPSIIEAARSASWSLLDSRLLSHQLLALLSCPGSNPIIKDAKAGSAMGLSANEQHAGTRSRSHDTDSACHLHARRAPTLSDWREGRLLEEPGRDSGSGETPWPGRQRAVAVPPEDLEAGSFFTGPGKTLLQRRKRRACRPNQPCSAQPQSQSPEAQEMAFQGPFQNLMTINNCRDPAPPPPSHEAGAGRVLLGPCWNTQEESVSLQGL